MTAPVTLNLWNIPPTPAESIPSNIWWLDSGASDTLAQKADEAYKDAQTIADLTDTNQEIATDYALHGTGLADDVATRWGQAVTAGVAPSSVGVEDPPGFPHLDEDAGALGDAIKEAFSTAFADFNPQFQVVVKQYIDALFPELSAQLVSNSDNWLLQKFVSGAYTPLAVEVGIWSRAQAREAAEVARSIVDIQTRGFSLPAGVLAATIAAQQSQLLVQQALFDRFSAIKAFDSADENSKVAIKAAVDLRVAFISDLGAYVRQAMVQPQKAVEYAQDTATAKQGLYNTVVRLYHESLRENALVSEVKNENRNLEVQVMEMASNSKTSEDAAILRKARATADVALQAAQQLGAIAAASYATRNSVLSVSAAV